MILRRIFIRQLDQIERRQETVTIGDAYHWTNAPHSQLPHQTVQCPHQDNRDLSLQNHSLSLEHHVHFLLHSVLFHLSNRALRRRLDGHNRLTSSHNHDLPRRRNGCILNHDLVRRRRSGPHYLSHDLLRLLDGQLPNPSSRDPHHHPALINTPDLFRQLNKPVLNPQALVNLPHLISRRCNNMNEHQ